MRIAIGDVPFSQEQIAELERIARAAGCEVQRLSPDAPLSPEALRGFEVLLGFFPGNVLKGLEGLRWMQTPTAGIDFVSGALDPASGVVVTNSSGAYGVAIAEYLMMGVLMLYRQMPAYMNNQRAHAWREEGPSRTIAGALVTVLGLGDLGRSFALRMRSMGAVVRGVRRSAGEKPDFVDALYPVSALADAVDGADIVAICLPGTQETHGLVSEAVLSRMKQDALLLNAGRGAIIDEPALIRALQTKKLGGAVLDVMQVEPLPPDSPLWDMDNVILTPHISGRTEDPACARIIYEIFLGNLERFLSGRPLTHVVDLARGY